MDSNGSISLQQQFGAKGICFGCGPCNERGLKINSYVHGDQVVAAWQPQEGCEGFEDMMNGGIISSLLDCHCNWAAAWYLMKDKGRSVPLSTVTAEFSISFLEPTPVTQPLHLFAECDELKTYKARIRAWCESNGRITAKFIGTFVAVKPNHPAFNQWGATDEAI